MSKTLDNILESRYWITNIMDSRRLRAGIIVVLEKGWEFEDEKGCCVRIFSTVAKAKSGTSRNKVVQKVIHIKMGQVI